MTAQGRCIRAGRSISYAEASVKDTKGNILAHGTSTLMVIPGKGIQVGVKKFLDQ
jgi:acyl-coenzyme A thioesterase PaaI-like protein